MYSRGPSIASIFQKAVLLKDTKCNKIIQRTLCSDSLIKFSKIEKFKPMKRYFSGASNNRNPNQRNRNIQGVGYIRKALPKFPREMVQQQQPLSMNEQMISKGIACANLAISVNGNTSGKITVVLDKNEICGCSAPDENIQIYVTTAPERMRSVQELSKADTTEVCSTQCKCCPQCQEVNNFGFQKTFSMRPNVNAFQQPSTMNFPNYLPMRRQNVNGLAFPGPRQNVYGLPQWNLRDLNGVRPLNLRKSRSMSDFPIMRKFIGQSQPINEALKVLPPPIQQSRGRDIILKRPDRRVGMLEGDRRAKRMDWLKREQRKYSSFDRNVIPENIPFKKPDVRQSKQPDTRQLPSQWNFNVLNGGRLLTLKKNRSMSDFQAMRKLIMPNSFNQMQTHSRQLPMKMHSSPIYQTHSINSMNSSGSFNNHQPPTSQGTMNPNLLQMRRRFSLLRQPSKNETPIVYSSPIQQTRSSGIVLQRPDKHTRSPAVDILDRSRYSKRTDELNEQDRTYNSIYRNFIPDNIPFNPADAKQSKQRDAKEIGRGKPRMNQPRQQSRFIVERVIKPATFSSVGRVLNKTNSIASALNEIAVTQKIKSHLGIHPRQSAVNSSNAPFNRKPDPFNLQEAIARNKFPAGRATAPRMLTSQNQNAFNGARQADNLSKSMSQVGLRQRFSSPGAGPMGNAGQANVLPKSKFSSHPLSIPPKQRSTESISQGKPLTNQRMINLKQFSVQRQPQVVVSKIISQIRPSFYQNHQITNFQPPNVSYKRKSNTQLHFGRPVQMRTNQMNHFGQIKQPPKFLLKKRDIPVMNLRRQKNRQPHGERRRSFIPIPQNSNPQMNVQKSVFDFRNRTRPSSISMIPVRNRFSQPNLVPLRRIPIQPFNRLVGLNQTKSISTPDATKERKSIGTHQRLKRDLVRKANNNQMQSFLPVNVWNQVNQIKARRPKSLEAAGRLNSNQQMQKLSQTPKLKINNPAVLFYAPGKLKLVDVPMPRLTDKKGVIVKILYVHLTDTDAQMLSAVQDGPYKLYQPTIAGKSGSGVIVDAGKKVENVKIGDKVSVKGLSCGKCTACENDNEVMCERVSITEKLGTLKRFHAVPAKFVTKLPDAVHPIDGAMIDELSSAIRACKKSTVTAGDNVLVLGGTSLGLWTALAAKSMGATNVCLADSRPLLLEQGKKLGIEQVFLIEPKSPTANTVKSIAEYMQGENPRIVFDCNGSSLTNEIAINTSMIGGKVVLMKNAISNQPTSLASAVDRGIDILSSQHGNDDSERAALQFLSSGKVQLKGIDSSFFNITNVHEAFGLLTSGTTANVFIQPNRPDDESNEKK